MAFKRIIPLLVAGFLILSGPAFASGTLVTPAAGNQEDKSKEVVSDAVCDPEVFNRMKEKAWAEAQRENYVNQSLILKPDSLFAITCFDKQLSNTMGSLGIKEKDDNGSQTNFEKKVSSSASAVTSAFIGPMKDGKPLLTPDKNTKTDTTSTEYEANPKAKSGSFNCGEMEKLWQQSQCGNFAAGDLPTLKEVGTSSSEARKYPQACTAGKSDNNNSQYDALKVLDKTYAPMAELKNATPVELKLCATEPFSKLAGLGCKQPSGQSDLCWPGALTGNEVSVGGKTYKEIKCSNSGCSPQVQGNNLICKKTP